MDIDIIKYYLNSEEYDGVFLYLNGNDKKDSIAVNKIDETLSNESALVITGPFEQVVNLNYVTLIQPFGK
ncbi:hypothetical protein [Staphylococcus edaphicus]|uniref:Uncharacterized protein n=1 Tax=Staphylococcus edaphicus TaxID=1955013 RepID=A0A2C6WKM7_9STAP|nr:hypothetical protein [Staphylococcus edaphicus]PHK48645.1 hypothetical protein BTJ66_12450 [Staphylococcus edaphicus]UQW80940.1 hypothetical protein MNY58_10160 [Staphylococcus edaphicus]